MNADIFITQAKQTIKGKTHVKIDGNLLPIKFSIMKGTNEYNTSITLDRVDGGAIADFYNETFWSRISRQRVELL